MLWYEVAGSALYYVTLPIVKLLLLLFYALRWILSPFLAIGNAILQLCLIPYYIAAKFEALWYFIGSAILVGCISAAICYGVLQGSVVLFNLDRGPHPKDRPARGPNVQSYRKARQRKKEQAEREQAEIEHKARALAESPLLREALKSLEASQAEMQGVRSRGAGLSLLDETIVEHSSEDDS